MPKSVLILITIGSGEESHWLILTMLTHDISNAYHNHTPALYRLSFGLYEPSRVGLVSGKQN